MPAEHRAILMLLLLAVGGQGVRYLLGRPGDAPGGVQILADARPCSSLAHRDSAVQLARPIGAGEKIDLDRATAADLARLPKVGPALARAIVSWREAHGAFGSLASLDSVPGIGPGLLRGLTPHAAFSGTRRPGLAALSPIPASPGTLPPPDSARPLDLNLASPQELDRLPGIGPAKAQAIVAYRQKHGPFRSGLDLAGIPGIGPSLAARLQNLAVVR
jgi:competence ComEA-like helix-hairpin-helix protein